LQNISGNHGLDTSDGMATPGN